VNDVAGGGQCTVSVGRLNSLLVAVLRTHPPDGRDEEGIALHVESAQVKEKRTEKLLCNFQECIEAGATACALFMHTSGIR